MDLNTNTPAPDPTKYCFTWCPKPIFHDMPFEQQFKETFKLLRRIRYSLDDDYKIYPELTINGNIHYHGLFSIKNKIHWFKTSLPLLRRYGFVRVDKLKKKYGDKWQEYIIKDTKDMIRLLDLSKDQFDDNGIKLQFKDHKKDIPIGNTDDTIYNKLSNVQIKEILFDKDDTMTIRIIA